MGARPRPGLVSATGDGRHLAQCPQLRREARVALVHGQALSSVQGYEPQEEELVSLLHCSLESAGSGILRVVSNRGDTLACFEGDERETLDKRRRDTAVDVCVDPARVAVPQISCEIRLVAKFSKWQANQAHRL